MSTIHADQLKNASEFMTKFWSEIVKPYYNPEDSDEWWTEFIDKCSRMSDKYGRTDKRISEMVLGFIKGVERTSKGQD